MKSSTESTSYLPHIWKHPTESQLYFHHGVKSGVSPIESDVGGLKMHQWNYIAATYDYGAGFTLFYVYNILSILVHNFIE